MSTSREVQLEAKVDTLTEEVRLLRVEVKECLAVMSGHIRFVESVYETVRSPLQFVKTRIETWMHPSALQSPADSHSLPQLPSPA
jgi:hypothetical protein